MARQGAEHLAVGQRDESRRLIRRSGEDRLPIGADDKAQDGTEVATGDAPARRAVACTPDPDRGIVSGGDDPVAVGRHAYTVDGSSRATQNGRRWLDGWRF